MPGHFHAPESPPDPSCALRDMERILFVHTEGGLGDLLLSSPIAEALKRRFPGSRITGWVNPSHRPILDGNPWFDAFLPFGGCTRFKTARRAISEGRYDTAILPWTTGRQAWLARVAGIPCRVGQSGRLAYSWLFTHPVGVRSARGDTTSHWVDIQLDYARALGCEPAGARPRVWLKDAERAAVRSLLAGRGVRPGEPLCGLHVGQGLPITLDRLPIDRLVEAGGAIARSLGMRLVLTGSPDEAPVVDEVARRIGSGAVSLAGKADLRTLCALIDELSVLVCPDTGPAHVAAALGVPAVVIMTIKSAVPERWRPYRAPHRLVTTGAWHCLKRCVKETCPRFECMDGFDAWDVVRAVQELTSERRTVEAG